jgi:hypothetical protein
MLYAHRSPKKVHFADEDGNSTVKKSIGIIKSGTNWASQQVCNIHEFEVLLC